KRQRRQESEYGRQLREKQKAKFIYGVLEKQFHMYYEKALKIEGITGDNLMTILESRLDNVVFRLGFARTRKEARQTVRHGHITVNGKRVDIPSYRVKAGDVVAVAPKFKDLLPIKEALISSEHMAVPAWLEVDIEKLQGTVLQLPTRDQIDLDINAQLIVELYSK
uniref:30S ribosomal protein S4 n=1 Tax=uncultured Parolsenella sp. TaxID=2083008 RepID=UPI0025F880D2